MSKIKYSEVNNRWELLDDSGNILDYASGSKEDSPWNLSWGSITITAGGSVDTTATDSDILAGETAVVRGKKITGTMPNRGSVIVTPTAAGNILEGGYYKDITIEADTDLIGSNIKEGITIFGVTGTLKEGSDITLPTGIDVQPEHVLDGVFYIDANGTKQEGTMPKLSAKTYTPSTKNQTISSGQYINDTQTIKGDANLQGQYIKQGVTIFGVTGTLESGDNTPAYYTVDGNMVTISPGVFEEEQIVEVGSAYYGDTDITPGTSTKNIPADTYLANSVYIAGDTNLTGSNIKYGSSIFEVDGTFTGDATATSDDILDGKTAYVKGQLVTGNYVPSSGGSEGVEFYECASVDPSTGGATGIRVSGTVEGLGNLYENYDGDYMQAEDDDGNRMFVNSGIGEILYEDMGYASVWILHGYNDGTWSDVFASDNSDQDASIADICASEWSSVRTYPSDYPYKFEEIGGSSSGGTWSGYKMTWGDGWVKAETPTSGLSINGYTPELGKVYSSDTTAYITLYPQDISSGDTDPGDAPSGGDSNSSTSGSGLYGTAGYVECLAWDEDLGEEYRVKDTLQGEFVKESENKYKCTKFKRILDDGTELAEDAEHYCITSWIIHRADMPESFDFGGEGSYWIITINDGDPDWDGMQFYAPADGTSTPADVTEWYEGMFAEGYEKPVFGLRA